MDLLSMIIQTNEFINYFMDNSRLNEYPILKNYFILTNDECCDLLKKLSAQTLPYLNDEELALEGFVVALQILDNLLDKMNFCDDIFEENKLTEERMMRTIISSFKKFDEKFIPTENCPIKKEIASFIVAQEGLYNQLTDSNSTGLTLITSDLDEFNKAYDAAIGRR